MKIGIIGYGHFGQFVHELITRFVPTAQVRVYSRRAVIDNERFFTLAEAAAAEVVVLCGGIAEYEAQLHAVLPHLTASSIVVDVATVKVHTERLCSELLGTHAYVCLHPMFGPESYKKRDGAVHGLRIVWTHDTLPDEVREQSRRFLATLGFTVVVISSDEHDALLAETLFLTHYVSQSLLAAGFARTTIDTASFSSLMDAVESVKNDQRLFADVYRFNPYCAAVAERLHEAQQKVFDTLPKE